MLLWRREDPPGRQQYEQKAMTDFCAIFRDFCVLRTFGVQAVPGGNQRSVAARISLVGHNGWDGLPF